MRALLRRHVPSLLVALLAFTPAAAQRTRADSLARAQVFESAGRLAEARALRAALSRPTAADSANLARLDRVIATAVAADAYLAAGHPELARRALSSLKLDTVRDAPLVLGVQARLARVAQAEARDRDGMAALFPGMVRPWARYMEALLRAVPAAMLYVLTAMALLWTVRALLRLRRPQPGQFTLLVEDLTGGDGGEDASRLLAREVSQAVREAARKGLAPGGPRQEDLDGATISTPSFRPFTPEIAGLADLLEKADPVKFGPVSFTPGQLFALASAALDRPPEGIVQGILGKDADGSTLLVAETRKTRGAAVPDRWYIREAGSGARGAVVRRMAACWLFDCGGWNVTRSRDGFLALVQGLDLLAREADATDADERERTLAAAVERFRTAAAEDENNLLAWLQLAEAQRRRGMNEAALRVLDRLQHCLRTRAAIVSGAAGCLGPEFRLYVCYHRALILSKSRRLKGLDTARCMLDGLLAVAEERMAGGRPPAELAQLHQMVLGALAAVAAGQAELLHRRMRRCHPHRRNEVARVNDERRFKAAAVRVNEAVRRLRALEAAGRVGDGRTYDQALAAALNASGRVAQLSGEFGVAIRMYEAASQRNPAMSDPYVGRAAALLRMKKRRPEWLAEAEQSLDRALARTPRNGRARYYRARVAWEQGDLARAADELRQADAHPATFEWRARVAVAKDADYAGAARFLRLSLRLDRFHDERWLLVVRHAVDHLRAVRGSREAPAHALREAEALVRSVVGYAKNVAGWSDNPSLQREAKVLLGEVRAALHTIPIPILALEPFNPPPMPATEVGAGGG